MRQREGILLFRNETGKTLDVGTSVFSFGAPFQFPFLALPIRIS